jgi:hypothetical protein
MKGKTKMKTTTNNFVLKPEMEIPQAWVAIKRNRQKIYNGQWKSQVYLKDGQEFQIELFNPTQTRYLVKFKINGNYSSNRGLILNPGQRYFLDRFIDEDRKLAFSTYEIEDSKAAKKAIEKNGLLEVEFYAETTFFNPSGTTYWRNPYFYYGENLTVGTANGSFTTTTGNSNTITYGGSTVNNISLTSSSTGSANSSYFTNSSNYSSIVNDASIETGRVERGEKSDQNFEDGYGTFNAWAAYTTAVQIIPLSQKPAEAQEIRSYCTGCGSRIKKQTWKFCPNCGTENN